MENPIRMDDLGVPLFLETPIYAKKENMKWFILWNQTYAKEKIFMVIIFMMIYHGRMRKQSSNMPNLSWKWSDLDGGVVHFFLGKSRLNFTQMVVYKLSIALHYDLI